MSLRRENVLIVLLDDVGVDMVAAYGLDPSLTPGLTPRLEEIAARGVIFDQAWSLPKCSPTRAAILTGRHAWRTGIGTVIGAGPLSLSPTELTLPKMLAGYAPAPYALGAFGKWHLESAQSTAACPPAVHGFDAFAGTVQALNKAEDFCNWMEVTCSPTRTTIALAPQYYTHEVFDQALAWIQAQGGSWLCYLAPQAPFEDHHVPPQSRQSLVSGIPCTACKTRPRPCYEAALQAVDGEIGRLLDALGPDWHEDTTIFLLGDNGTPADVATLWPAGQVPGTAFEGGVHVPFVVGGAAVDPLAWGTHRSELVHVVDIYRTVAGIAGASGLPAESAQDSLDLAPLLDGSPAPAWRSSNYTETFKPNGAGPYVKYLSAERGARFKVLYDCVQASATGLYDLALDPLETTNLISPLPAPGSEAGDAFLTLRDALLRRSLCAGDGAAPEIEGPIAVAGETRVLFSWTTGEPSPSRVDWGTSAAYGNLLYAPTAVTAHLALASGLASDTELHWRLQAWDETGYLTTLPDASVRTLPFVGQLPVSDDFDGPIDPGLWTFVDPLEDATLSSSGTQAVIALASGLGHAANGLVNTLPRLRQSVSDLDFDVEATFDSGLTQDFQSQGVLIEESSLVVLRVELRRAGGATEVAAVATRGGAPRELASAIVPLVPPMSVRCARVGDDFTISWSSAGQPRTTLATLKEPLIVSGVSVYAGNDPAVPHTAVVDAFLELSPSAPAGR